MQDQLGGPDKPDCPERRRQPHQLLIPTVAIYTVLTVLIGLIATIAARSRLPGELQGSWIHSWIQFDGGWYLHIAQHGYAYTPGQMSAVGFFPTFPVAIGSIAAVVGHPATVAVLVSLAASFLSVLLFVHWCSQRVPRSVAITAVALLMLYPYSLYLYGAVYGDSLFLLSTLGALMLVERRHYWLAGLAGIAATAGRSVGMAVAVALVVGVLAQLADDQRPVNSRGAPVSQLTFRELVRAVTLVRWRHTGVLLAPLGLVAWMGFLWVRFGDPFAWLAVQASPGWDQGSGPKTWFKLTFIGYLFRGYYGTFTLVAIQAIMGLLAFVLMRRVWREWGWMYTAYAVLVLAIPVIGTKDFMGMGRYVMVTFPVFAAAALVVSRWRPAWRYLIYTVFFAGLVTTTILFSKTVLVS